MNRKLQKGFMLLAIIAGALLAVSPANAVDFGISGQINRAVMYVDDGSTAKWFFVDNENSSTRFRFTGSNDFENSWKVGIVWEVEMQSNSSNEVAWMIMTPATQFPGTQDRVLGRSRLRQSMAGPGGYGLQRHLRSGPVRHHRRGLLIHGGYRRQFRVSG